MHGPSPPAGTREIGHACRVPPRVALSAHARVNAQAARLKDRPPDVARCCNCLLQICTRAASGPKSEAAKRSAHKGLLARRE